ncbi:phosphocholine cytidylyltransferase family protein [Burkholderiales bacterium]|jgi:L-glutamine-phosphate cytidylyltransferase|nr:phosphocholine cytidylyltransferase family protein [Burkholderiales bacterium]
MTRALILAAGQGVRLRPLTDDKPKCLVPLLGRSLLERQADTLKEFGINDIHIVTGYRADQIEALGFTTSINPKFSKTNMVESLFSAQPFIQQEGDLIIAYGDIVYQSNNLRALLNCNDEIALMIDTRWRDLWSMRLDDPLDDAETLMMNDDGYVTELGKKPESYDQIEGQYTGLIKIRSDKLEALIAFYNQLDRSAIYDGKDFNNIYMTSFLQLLINSGWKAKAVLVNSGWLEVDSVKDLFKYEAMAKEGILDRFYKVEN